MLKQDMMILKFVLPYDEILNDQNAFWEDDTKTMYSSARYPAVWEFNKHGYRVLQFIPNRSGDDRSEWVLVEKLSKSINLLG